MNKRETRFFGVLLNKSRLRIHHSKIRIYLFGITLGVMLAAVLLLAFWPRYKIFTLDTNTEIADFIVVDPRFSEWELAGSTVYLNPFSEQPDYKDLDRYSYLQLNKGASVTLQRHGLGPIHIKVSLPDNETAAHLFGSESAKLQSVGTISYKDGESIDLKSWASITVPVNMQPRVLPFRGFLTVGDDVANQVDSILLDGLVAVVEEKLLSRGHYIAGEDVLNPGDRVRLLNLNRKPVAMDGFFRAEPPDTFSEPENAFRLTAHGKADHARVDRLGSAGFEVFTQPWTRFVNDPVLAIVFAVIAGLALLLEVFFKLMEISKVFGVSTVEPRHPDRKQDND